MIFRRIMPLLLFTDWSKPLESIYSFWCNNKDRRMIICNTEPRSYVHSVEICYDRFSWIQRQHEGISEIILQFYCFETVIYLHRTGIKGRYHLSMLRHSLMVLWLKLSQIWPQKPVITYPMKLTILTQLRKGRKYVNFSLPSKWNCLDVQPCFADIDLNTG